MSDLDDFYAEALANADDDGGDVDDADLDGWTGADGLVTDDDDSDDVTDDGDEHAGDDSDEDTDDGATDADADDFDWHEYGSRKVTIKVQGKEVKVPLAEAISGYMRQSDYTQKTQANAEALRMAQWAQQLREAIQNDPQGTIGTLAQVYGLNVGNPRVDPQTDTYENVDPEFIPFLQAQRQQEQEIAQLRAALQRQEQNDFVRTQEMRMAEIKSEMQAVEAEFPDFDPFEVLPVARDHDLSIRDAYFLVSSQKRVAQERLMKEAEAEAAKKAEVVSRKREMAKKVPSGRGPNGKAAPADMEFNSFEEMLEYNLKANRRS